MYTSVVYLKGDRMRFHLVTVLWPLLWVFLKFCLNFFLSRLLLDALVTIPQNLSYQNMNVCKHVAIEN